MIELADNRSCTACSACLNICPQKAISFLCDSEGFYQPNIDTELCIECGLCMKICPQITINQRHNHQPIKCYAAYSPNYQKKSSSGGLFSAIAEYILKQNGIIYGAAFDDNLQLKHKRVERLEDISPLRGSKYLQSDLSDVFKLIKNDLKESKIVLFSGTPCQIAGLQNFLNKYNNNLITIDLVCHGVPSQMAFDKWINSIKKYPIRDFQFRKLDGWSMTPKIIYTNGKQEILRFDKEIYMWAFYKGYLFRPCCYTCKYANTSRVGDITLADFWGIGKFKQKKAKGISLVLANTPKGLEILTNIKETIYIEERNLSEALQGQENLRNPFSYPEERKTSAIDFISKMSLLDFGKKYNLLPKNKYKYLIIAKAKNTLINLGFFDYFKELFSKL